MDKLWGMISIKLKWVQGDLKHFGRGDPMGGVAPRVCQGQVCAWPWALGLLIVRSVALGPTMRLRSFCCPMFPYFEFWQFNIFLNYNVNVTRFPNLVVKFWSLGSEIKIWPVIRGVLRDGFLLIPNFTSRQRLQMSNQESDSRKLKKTSQDQFIVHFL